MLVLSRRVGETVSFPTLNVSVQVTRVDGRIVRLGVDAPRDVPIARGELVDDADAARERHAHRNRLNKVTLALHLLSAQLENGLAVAAQETLASALRHLADLESATRPVPSAGVCRVLIVEDDANERELLAGLFALQGCDVASAADGERALAHLAANDLPDLVVLDMAMPGLDGPGTVRRIRANQAWRGLPVFSVSGTSPSGVGLSTGPDGVDRWFPKPLNPQHLWNAIRERGLTLRV